MRGTPKGFLLIELGIVVALLCLLTVFVHVSLTFSRAGYVRTALDQLYATCLMAQQRAMMTGSAQQVALELDNNAYWYGNERVVFPQGVVFGIIPEVKGPPASPRTLLSTSSTFAHHTITCSPEGILSAGTVYLRDRDKTVLYALSSGVGSVSFLRKYRYAKEWHYS